MLLARGTGLPFHLTVKLWPILADAGLALLVWRAARRRLGERMALWLGLAYAANPVAILTSAFHGNQTVLGVLFAFWAYERVAGTPEEARARYRGAGLLLGLGVAARSFPVLLAPVFALLLPLGAGTDGLKRRATFLALVALPTAVASLPALVADSAAYVRELTTYSGFADQGWLALRRGFGVVTGTGKRFPPDTEAWLLAGKLLFLALYALLLAALVRRRHHDLAAGCLLAWLLFLVAYGGVSTHYLAWVIPFGLLASPLWTAGYTAAATLSMVGFYLTWFPGVLLGPHAPERLGPAPAADPVWRFYLGALALSWLLNLAWLAREARRLATGRTSSGTPSA
jgi:4-amino-4-deoxy-L-arabinose transferase-like glycosyltransferase